MRRHLYLNVVHEHQCVCRQKHFPRLTIEGGANIVNNNSLELFKNKCNLIIRFTRTTIDKLIKTYLLKNHWRDVAKKLLLQNTLSLNR